MTGARADQQFGNRLRQLAKEREFDFTVSVGQALGRRLLPDQLNGGMRDRPAARARRLDCHREAWAERGDGGQHGRLRKGAYERGSPQGMVWLDDERAGHRAAQHGRGSVGRAHHRNRRTDIFALGIGSQDFDIFELVQSIDQGLPGHAESRRRDHVLAVARAHGLAPAATRGGAPGI